MVQWVKYFLQKHEEQNSNLQHPCKQQVSRPTQPNCNPTLQKHGQDLKSKQCRQRCWNGSGWVQVRNPDNSQGEEWERKTPSANLWTPHTGACRHVKHLKHTFTWVIFTQSGKVTKECIASAYSYYAWFHCIHSIIMFNLFLISYIFWFFSFVGLNKKCH